MVKNLHAVWETWVLSLCWDDPLKKATSKQVFWPGEFHGQRSLAGSSPWSCKESDTIEQIKNEEFYFLGFFQTFKIG